MAILRRGVFSVKDRASLKHSIALFHKTKTLPHRECSPLRCTHGAHASSAKFLQSNFFTDTFTDSDQAVSRNCRQWNHMQVEPMVGIEPTTYGLRNRCSTTELHWRAGRAANLYARGAARSSRGHDRGVPREFARAVAVESPALSRCR